MAKKYGHLGNNWKEDIKQGFNECFRVLENYGVLIFKWNEAQIKLNEILKLTDVKPLFGNRRAKTHWLVVVDRKTGEYSGTSYLQAYKDIFNLKMEG